MNRREFISAGLTAAAATAMGATNPVRPPKKPTEDLIWMSKFELGWLDQCGEKDPMNPKGHYCGVDAIDPFVEESFWRRIKAAKAAGANAVYVTLMEAVKYPSHPEIALEGALEAGYLHDLMKKVRDDYGMKTFPSLNFSTSHHLWLGQYSRMVSSPTYYKVCADILKDVYEIFGKPELVNFGMDEEMVDKITKPYNVVRTGDLYWHDFNFFVKTIEKLGGRPWCYADNIWWGVEPFVKNVPKSVLLSNWYYCSTCDLDEIKELAEKAGQPKLYRQFSTYLTAFNRIEEAGYDQMPSGSDWYDRLDKAAKRDRKLCEQSFPNLVKYCTKTIAPERLKGFYVTHWIGHNPRTDARFDHFASLLARGKKMYETL